MRAAVVDAPRSIVLRDVAAPQPASGQVRVRLEGCGICASNVPVWEGRDWFSYPLEPGAPGHEGWGQIEAVGEGVSDLRVGDRVALLSYHAYAECDVAAADQVVALPPELDDLPFPGEPLGCAMNVFQRSGIEAGQWVAVVGVGFLGALLVRLAKNAGARVLALSRRESACRIAGEAGADEALPLDDPQRAIEHVRRLTGGDGCDCVIEATGYQQPLDLASELVRVRGRLVVAGYHQDGGRQVNMQQWNWRGLDVINAHERDSQVYIDGIRRAVAEIVSGRLDPVPLYSHTFPLNELAAGLEATRLRPEGFSKALVLMDD